MTDSKADPEAIFFRGEKAMKYLGKILRWNARAAIAERKIYRIILFDPCREQNFAVCDLLALHSRSAAHTSELQSLMRISYAVFCLTKNSTDKSHIRPRHPSPNHTATTY